MRLWTRSLIAALVAAGCLSVCGAASAADVLLGPELTGTLGSLGCGESCTVANIYLEQPNLRVTSPVAGVVVRWNVLGGVTEGTYRLRAMTPLAAESFLFGGESAAVASVPTPGLQTFTATMPIAAGQVVALDLSPTAEIGVVPPEGILADWYPPPADATSPAPRNIDSEFTVAFNAEVQPVPTIVSLGTTSGSTAGGTSVAIAGTDFANVSAVSFGGNAASSYTVNSESQITAVAPAAGSGSVPISVTTIAGKATSAQTFNYTAPSPSPSPPPAPAPPAQCVVPKLKGKKLEAVRKALSVSRCKLGTVTKKEGATGKSGKVTRQSRTPRTSWTAGTKVNVTLKP